MAAREFLVRTMFKSLLKKLLNYLQILNGKSCMFLLLVFMTIYVFRHLIGHLQSSKAAKLIKDVPNLTTIETVDSIKIVDKLQNACQSIGRQLDVYIQVKTSEEDSKYGVDESQSIELIQHMIDDCPNLHVIGLMTIGAPNDTSCFTQLMSIKLSIEKHFEGMQIPMKLLLSMGMSGDYETAIQQGANVVRIGSSIFGTR